MTTREIPVAPALRSAGAWAQLRPVARRVHFLAGLLVAPFVLLLCLTGLFYVFSPQIHADLYAHQLYVDQVGDATRPVAEQVAAAMAAHPEGRLLSVVPPPAPDRTTQVRLSMPGRAQQQPGEARTIYVDPYTNYINGDLTTVGNRLPANVWLRDLHGNLHLGEVGRLYSEAAASWLPVITLSGFALWVGKQGRRRRNARELLVPAPRGNGDLSRLRAVHGPLGLWLTVGLLTMSVTGLAMSPFAGSGLFDTRAPTLASASVPVPADARQIGLDRVLEVARAEGLSGQLDLRPPAAPDRPFTVAEFSPGLPVQRDSIAVDPYTAQITERVGWADYPFPARLRVLAVEAHTGTLFGLANQILLALFAVATIVLILVGYRLWWKRSPYRGQPPSAPPPSLRGLSIPMGVTVLLVTAVHGWLMPVFGVSLVTFLLVDAVISTVRRRQERLRTAVVAGALLAAGCVAGAVLLADVSPFGGGSSTDRPAPGANPGLSPPTNEAGPDGGLDVTTVPPASVGFVAFPGGPPAGIAGGADGTGGSTASGGSGAVWTPAAGSGAGDPNTGAGPAGDPAAAGTSPGAGIGGGDDLVRGAAGPMRGVVTGLPQPVAGNVGALAGLGEDAAGKLVPGVAVAWPTGG